MGLGAGVAVCDLIQAACAAMADALLRGQDCAHIRIGYRRRGVGEHVLYFRPTGYGIAVVRILHRRMEAELHI